MPRAAGDKGEYTWVLRNEGSGRYITNETISLPSVTTIISRTLGKPALVPWTYKITRDYISGTVSTLLDLGVPAEDVCEMLADEAWISDYLKENRLRPEDFVKDSSARGIQGHSLLEDLGRIGEEDSEAAHTKAVAQVEGDKLIGWDRGIADWWVKRTPYVVAAEKLLVSLRYRFAGTCDLIWMDGETLTITDLKTRLDDKDVYESDHVQTGAYKVAWDENNPRNRSLATSVLVVHEDGTWIEEQPKFDNTRAFLALKDVHDTIRGGV